MSSSIFTESQQEKWATGKTSSSSRFFFFGFWFCSDGRFEISFVVIGGTIDRTAGAANLHLNLGQPILHFPLLPIEFGTERSVFRLEHQEPLAKSADFGHHGVGRRKARCDGGRRCRYGAPCGVKQGTGSLAAKCSWWGAHPQSGRRNNKQRQAIALRSHNSCPSTGGRYRLVQVPVAKTTTRKIGNSLRLLHIFPRLN